MKKQNEWEEVGKIGVDAGLCWIGDPCYCVTPDATEHPAETWDKFCEKLFTNGKSPDIKQWNWKSGNPGLGVSVSTGNGDGMYPVLIKRIIDDDGCSCIAEVKVIFLPRKQVK